MDSVVTLPTRSGTYRSRSGARRRPRQPTVFSTTTSAAASSFFASSDEFEDAIHPRSYSSRRTHVASSTEPSAPPPVPMLPSSQAFLVRRRSLPSAKPAPSSHLPTLPTSSPGASSSRVQRGRNPQPATSRKDPHISFVPTESSSGSSSNTVLFNATQSYLLSPLSTTAQSKGKAPSAANYLTTTEMSSTNCEFLFSFYFVAYPMPPRFATWSFCRQGHAASTCLP
ncbi:hypothetical protein DL93DRAFT_2075662 [Clavulina sp. PMI_390]|nr:hypothetical protein DL93DRAFT_2075662 [Clavulina sp. PMI_390]